MIGASGIRTPKWSALMAPAWWQLKENPGHAHGHDEDPCLEEFVCRLAHQRNACCAQFYAMTLTDRFSYIGRRVAAVGPRPLAASPPRPVRWGRVRTCMQTMEEVEVTV